jgi:hypothetical protein
LVQAGLVGHAGVLGGLGGRTGLGLGVAAGVGLGLCARLAGLVQAVLGRLVGALLGLAQADVTSVLGLADVVGHARCGFAIGLGVGVSLRVGLGLGVSVRVGLGL